MENKLLVSTVSLLASSLAVKMKHLLERKCKAVIHGAMPPIFAATIECYSNSQLRLIFLHKYAIRGFFNSILAMCYTYVPPRNINHNQRQSLSMPSLLSFKLVHTSYFDDHNSHMKMQVHQYRGDDPAQVNQNTKETTTAVSLGRACVL